MFSFYKFLRPTNLSLTVKDRTSRRDDPSTICGLHFTSVRTEYSTSLSSAIDVDSRTLGTDPLFLTLTFVICLRKVSLSGPTQTIVFPYII